MRGLLLGRDIAGHVSFGVGHHGELDDRVDDTINRGEVSPATMATTGGPPNRASARTTPSSLQIAWQAARGPGLVVEMNTYASIAIGANIAAAADWCLLMPVPGGI